MFNKLQFIFIISFIWICDRYFKNKALTYLQYHDIKISNLIILKLIHNKGISFGLLSNSKNIFLLIILFAVTIYIIYLLIKTNNKIDAILLSIIIGGALGNITDRLLYNNVLDYIYIYPIPVFNFADLSIVSAGIIYLYRYTFNKNIKSNQETTKKKY